MTSTPAPARARPGPKPGRGESTRRRLLAAAESVFAELGYHEASIVRITEQAGVAQGTFYLYFASKQQIFEEVVADLNHRVRQAMTSASDGAPSRMEAERRGFAAFFRFTAEHPALYRVIRQAEFVSPAAMRGHYERIIAGYVSRLEAGMADGEVAAMDPAVLAWALIAVGEMTGLRWILWDDARAMPPAVFEQVMTVVGRMLGGPAPGQDATGTDTTDTSRDTNGSSR